MSAGIQKGSSYKMTPGIFEVQSILQRGRSGNEIFYLIKWKGYSEQEATWEPESNLSGCREAILEFQNIIKQMEQQKSKTEAEALRTKRKARKDKQRQFLTSQSKEISQEETISNGHLKKSQVQKQTLTSNQPEIKENLIDQLQKLETKSMKNSSNQDNPSQSQNEILESTTAQTIPSKITDKQQGLQGLTNHLFQKRSLERQEKVKVQTFGKKDSYQNPQQSIKLNNSFIQQNSNKSKTKQLKRQRQKHENSSKRNQRITKKNKKQIPQDNQIQINTQQISKKAQKQNQINKMSVKLPQQNIFKPNDEINPQSFKTKNSLLEKIKTQDFIKKPPSQRTILCDQEFLQLTIEMIGSLDPRLRSNLKLQQDQRSLQNLRYLITKFIDLSSSSFSLINEKIKRIILTKEQVEKLDNQGDFLYCDIQSLIKITESEKDEKKYQWVCVLRNHETDEKQEIQNCYFVKIDDLRSEMWKKKFRKFLVPKP